MATKLHLNRVPTEDFTEDRRGKHTYSVRYEAIYKNDQTVSDQEKDPYYMLQTARGLTGRTVVDDNDNPVALPYRWDPWKPIGAESPGNHEQWDKYSYAQDFQVTKDPQRETRWLISVDYSPLEAGANPELDNNYKPFYGRDNPKERPPIVTYSSETESVLVEFDRDGRPVLNSAGRNFPDQSERLDSRTVIEISGNVATHADALKIQQTYQDTTNSADWKWIGWEEIVDNDATYPVDSVLCRRAEIRRIVNDGPSATARTFWQVHLEFVVANLQQHEYNSGGSLVQYGTWRLKKTDKGFAAFVFDSEGSLKTIQNPSYPNDNQKVTSEDTTTVREWFLDGNGGWLSHSADPSSIDPVILNFDIYRQADFNAIFGNGTTTGPMAPPADWFPPPDPPA